MPASVILHALIFSFLVYGLTKSPDQPKDDQAIDVSLVSPPEPPKPKPAPEPAKKEPEPEKPQKTAEKPPPPEKAPESPPAKQQPNPPPVEQLKPVFQYGDKDTGPRKSLDGSSAQDSAKSPDKADDSTPPAAAKDIGEKAVAAKEADPPQDAEKQPDGAPAPLAATGGDNEVALPATAEAPKPRPANAPKSESRSPSKTRSTDVASAGPQGDSGLPGVRKLYSQGATGDAHAEMAMSGVSRDQRAAELCASVLYRQLLDASYFAELVPSVPLDTGNVLSCPDTAFRTRTTWYRLSFQCEVDTNATKVVSFNYRVGAQIPPEEQGRYRNPRCQ